TPLMHAANCGNVAAVRWFLQKGADPWAQDRCGKRTALHYATMRGRLECIEALLDAMPSTGEMRRCGRGHRHLASPTFPDLRRRLDGFNRLPYQVAMLRDHGGVLVELLHPSARDIAT
ncbi:hypothetical protein TSOC_013078, partial [Tetrabaena socialis]